MPKQSADIILFYIVYGSISSYWHFQSFAYGCDRCPKGYIANEDHTKCLGCDKGYYSTDGVLHSLKIGNMTWVFWVEVCFVTNALLDDMETLQESMILSVWVHVPWEHYCPGMFSAVNWLSFPSSLWFCRRIHLPKCSNMNCENSCVVGFSSRMVFRTLCIGVVLSIRDCQSNGDPVSSWKVCVVCVVWWGCLKAQKSESYWCQMSLLAVLSKSPNSAPDWRPVLAPLLKRIKNQSSDSAPLY